MAVFVEPSHGLHRLDLSFLPLSRPSLAVPADPRCPMLHPNYLRGLLLWEVAVLFLHRSLIVDRLFDVLSGVWHLQPCQNRFEM